MGKGEPSFIAGFTEFVASPADGSALPNHNNLLWCHQSKSYLICKIVTRSTSYQHDSHTNKHTNNYRPWVGPKEVLFCPDFFFLFFFRLFLFWLFCSLSFLHLVFIKKCHREGFFFSPSTADVSESSNNESSLQQISHGDKATQRIPAVCRERSEKTHYQQLLVRVCFFLFFSSAQPTWVLLCISFENKAPFWSNVSFLQVSFLFICILYMFTLYLALPNRETILNVLSLLFYIGSASFIPHLQSQGTVADKDKGHFGHNRHLAG